MKNLHKEKVKKRFFNRKVQVNQQFINFLGIFFSQNAPVTKVHNQSNFKPVNYYFSNPCRSILLYIYRSISTGNVDCWSLTYYPITDKPNFDKVD